MPVILLLTTNTCPPLASSRVMALRRISSSYGVTYVCTGNLSPGGSSIRLMSLMPVSDMLSVRGIGVADSVSTSMLLLSSLIFSLWRTPNLCSSSTTRSPRSLNLTSSDSILCVPMIRSTLPLLRPLIALFTAVFDLNLESSSISNGNISKRSRRL